MITAGPTKRRCGSHPVAAKDEERETNGSGTESKSDMTVGGATPRLVPDQRINLKLVHGPSARRVCLHSAYDTLFDLELFVQSSVPRFLTGIS